MLKLLIVDDEKITRETLAEHIPWSDLGIGTVRTARNGQEALATIDRYEPPDILLTDVRMPKMDGIELVRELRMLVQDCKVIFLSGFADKEYLKSAIEYKALSYIEKPINIDEVIDVITKAVQACCEEAEKRDAMDSLLREKRILMRQEIALELSSGNLGMLGTALDDGGLSLRFAPEGRYNAAYAVLNWSNELHDRPVEEAKQAILRSLSDDTLCDPSDLIAGFDAGHNLILIASERFDGRTPAMSDLFSRVAGLLAKMAGDRYSYAVGIGDSVKGLGKIRKSYTAAVLAASGQFYDGPNHVFHYDPRSRAAFVFDKSNFSLFKKCLEAGDQAKAGEIVEGLTKEIQAGRTYDINRVKNIYFHLLLFVFDTALARGLIDPFANEEQTYIWHEIEAINSLSALSDYVAASIGSILGHEGERDAVDDKIRRIEHYIATHFSDHGLSVQGIADHVYLSPTYLCAFFKKSTGKTLNEFITDMRIKRAKELLKDNRAKLYEVALEVGFTDPDYFSTLFKKCVGRTPSEFKGK